MLACRAFSIQKGDRSDIVFGPVGMMIINFGKLCDSGANKIPQIPIRPLLIVLLYDVVCYEARHP